MQKRVLFWGRFDPGYSRNRVYAALFRELGWEVDYFFVKVWPRFGDVEAFLRGLGRRPKPDLVWVPVARQRDVAAACRWAHRRGIKVVFDPMISAWDKKVLEQRNAEGKTTVEGEEASPLPKNFDALKVGTEVQTKLSGRPFNYDFCPAEDYYLKAHLFGDIFARDVLTHAERELITVSALCGMDGVEPQLKAHVNGARNMGLTDAQLQAIPAVLAAKVGKNEAIRASKAISEVLGVEDELGLKAQNAVDLKSFWPKGELNTAYAQYFIGNSYLAPMGGDMVNVTFEPGCRNNWHIHHGMVQVLVCVYGRGWYQEWGKPAVPLTEGTVIAIPEGVKHWHGAAKGSWMQHLTYHKEVQEGASNEWLEPVNDEIYGKLK